MINEYIKVMKHGTFNTVIMGYSVEVETFEEGGEERSQGWVSKGDFSGSLDLMNQTGRLEDGDNYLDVSERADKAIMAWAESKGY